MGDAVGIEVSASSGSVVLEEGAAHRVLVEVDTRRPEAWRVYQSGDTVYVTYERGFIDSGGRARVRVAAPAGSSLTAQTASADVRSTLGHSHVSVATASGDISVEGAGSATLKTASGDVALGDVETHLEVRSASGDVVARSVGGRAILTTVSGDVRLDRVDGDLVVSTASGDVRIARYGGEDLEASTVSGDVWLALPAGRTVELDARTFSGSVDLPERKQTQTAGGPPVSVRMKSVSGNIRITRAD